MFLKEIYLRIWVPNLIKMTSKYLILIKFISLILLISACSSPNYINKNKMNNLRLSSDIQFS